MDKAKIASLQNALNAIAAKVGATGAGAGTLVGAGLMSPEQLFALVDTDGSGPAFVTNGCLFLRDKNAVLIKIISGQSGGLYDDDSNMREI